MEKSKIKLIIGLCILGLAIPSALVGTWFYQNAIIGIIYTIEQGSSYLHLIMNMQIAGVMANAGVLATIIGVGLLFSSKND